MPSPLSFNSTENFRKKLLVKNLPPFNSDGFAPSTNPGQSELILSNYAVVDSAEVEDIGDEYQIGKVNNETLKLIDSAIDKKLSLAKLQSQIVSSNKEEDSSNTNSDGGINEEDKDLLRQLFKEQQNKSNTEYDLDDD